MTKRQELPGAGAAEARPLRALLLPTADAARQELLRIGVDPGGIARMLPKLRLTPVLLPGLRAPAANIVKQEMLSLGGDAAVARGTVACSIAHSDVLLIGTRRQLTDLCRKLQSQPFGLAKVAAELSALLERLDNPPRIWRLARRSLPLARPLVMGILNITPDSFSDGGQYLSPDEAVERALSLEAEGADLLDIGGESTRPGSPEVPAEEELRRVLPVIEALAGRLAIPISIDTWKAQVAQGALTAGAEIVNDISGLRFDPLLADVAAQHQAGLVLMHTRGRPQTMQQDTAYDDLLGEVSSGLLASAERACAAGVAAERIVLDPGIGFAKDLQGNLELLRRLEELTGLGFPLLVGASRKSFIGRTLGRDNPQDRLFGTAATVALAVASGASVLRVHDVRAMREVIEMTCAILPRNVADGGS